MKSSVSCFLQHPVISHQVTALFIMYLFYRDVGYCVGFWSTGSTFVKNERREFKSSRVLEVNLTLTWWLVSFLVRLCCCNQSAVSIPSSPWFCLCCLLFMSRWGVGSLPAHLDICCTESAVWCLKHFIRLKVKVNTVTTSGAGVSSVSDFKLCCFVSPLTAS